MTTGAAAPRVAVLLSTYNGEAYLEAQLDSLAAQEGVSVEVFVRDDGSRDGTPQILARHAGRWPQLAQPLGGANLGPARSFLDLMARVPEGFDFYAFCDQDDVWLPHKLDRAARRLQDEAADGPALYCSRVMCVDKDLRPLGPSLPMGTGRFEQILFANMAIGNTVVMNAAAAALVRSRLPERGAIMHDWWCALVISALGRIVFDEEPGVLYRQHQANAIGALPNRLASILSQIPGLLRDPKAFYPIHAQAAEFLRLFGDRLDPARLELVRALVESRRSLLSRLRYALLGRMPRTTLLGALSGRALVAANLY